MNPKVSVLMPIYNVAPFIKEAIDSILAQSFADFELITLNDCSEDNSQEIIDTYNDPRIVRYIGDANVGLANILNKGLSLAKGDYIARMDPDDISLPDRFETQVKFLETHKDIDLVSAGMKKFGASSDSIVHHTSFEDVKFNAIYYSPVLHASSMWRRQKFIDKGLYYRQEMVPSEDYDLWTRAILKGVRLANLPIILYKYRIHDRQVTTVNKDWSTTEEISRLYFSSIFPEAGEILFHDISNLFKERDTCKIKDTIIRFEDENRKSDFFDRTFLHKKLNRYYQSVLYSKMADEGIVWPLIFKLRWKQILKLMLPGIR